MDKSKKSKTDQDSPQQETRRNFLGKSALLGLAGAGVSLGLAGCKEDATAAKSSASASAKAVAAGGFEVAPGQLDEYYSFTSSGHGGDARIVGIPSGRTLKRIPIFNIDCMVGWGITNESKAIMGTKADGSLKYTTGDTHHVHGSYKDGTYDSRWLFTNDKIHSRLARIRMDTMECDKIIELPNVMGFHGIFPDKRDPVDPKINYTTRVFCGQEFHTPLP
ncbi:MAG TPA: TAT-dependent nitrous-oxide reductase, partial [Oxalobacteraceae bacterium]|nr:TAT-dependent nitrous-oxide reductase [Oxalobacteraceae bacterium]